MQKIESPFVMVIFGATGDLTARKLIPSLYKLFTEKSLPDKFFIVGFARRDITFVDFRNLMREAVMKNQNTKIKNQNDKDEFNKNWNKFEKNIYYHQGFFEDKIPYQKLVSVLSTFDKEIGACIARFFYLATPPQNYSTILSHLDSSKLSEGCGQGSSKWTRILIEKPFGKDLETSRRLEEQLSNTFSEHQIYRIDHYLAKDTVQNILVFRFANKLFQAVWNKDNIDNIQVTIAESGGIGERGKFYDGIGALRDVAQNHLMALLAYIAMEEPASFTSNDIHNERIKVIEAIRCIEPADVDKYVVRGQYGRGKVFDRDVTSFRQEKDIDPKSLTETFVAYKLYVDNERWKDVPFYFRTGKRLKASVVTIDVQFKNPLSKLFANFTFERELHANTLRIRIQPRESINFRFLAKVPGVSLAFAPVNMEFSYERSFKNAIVDSYEKLLLDSMLGDQTLFATSRGFKATWEFVTRIILGWDKLPPPKFPNYSAGTWGPKEADELLLRDGRHWLLH